MMEWLEPAIEQRVSEVSDACEEQTNEIYEELLELLTQLDAPKPLSSELTSRIENIFVLKTNIIVNNAYKAGFKDGMYIGSKLR